MPMERTESQDSQVNYLGEENSRQAKKQFSTKVSKFHRRKYLRQKQREEDAKFDVKSTESGIDGNVDPLLKKKQSKFKGLLRCDFDKLLNE